MSHVLFRRQTSRRKTEPDESDLNGMSFKLRQIDFLITLDKCTVIKLTVM